MYGSLQGCVFIIAAARRRARDIEGTEADQRGGNEHGDNNDDDGDDESNSSRGSTNVDIVPIYLIGSGHVIALNHEIVFIQEFLSFRQTRHAAQAPSDRVAKLINQSILFAQVDEHVLGLEVPEVHNRMDWLEISDDLGDLLFLLV